MFFSPTYEICFLCFHGSLLVLQGVNISDHFSTIRVVVKGAADLPGGQDASPEQNKIKEIPQNSPQGEIQGEAAAAGAAGSDWSRGGGRTAGAAGEVRSYNSWSSWLKLIQRQRQNSWNSWRGKSVSRWRCKIQRRRQNNWSSWRGKNSSHWRSRTVYAAGEKRVAMSAGSEGVEAAAEELKRRWKGSTAVQTEQRH